MVQKQTIIGRMTTLARANINAILDRAEDPEKMLDQMVRDYTNAIADAEEAVAQTIASLRMAEEDYEQDKKVAEDWGQKAAAASTEADRLRAAGQAAEADKFDNLAKAALEKQIGAESDAQQAEPMVTQQRQTVETLKQGLVEMRSKLDDLKSRRDTLVARAKTADAQAQVSDAMGSISILDPSSELGRFEEKVRRQEALAQGRQEAQAATLEGQFEQLEDSSKSTEVEARLATLKNKQA
ncbi:phage shock protein A (PspA) family protein [Kytococcus aerolatus]|uniref:Phage shock protein A (PspA) family protein n=1 Tax=Kytococcus aerolatus TaxID=592308 RepID=A0A212U7T8_9MICO|nr:PspA/IM30 family protein [Kytococcus aerolatus]SNC74317.1 phage shock protein A (PspA) family protein [Kytococcus aerolatus]